MDKVELLEKRIKLLRLAIVESSNLCNIDAKEQMLDDALSEDDNYEKEQE